MHYFMMPFLLLGVYIIDALGYTATKTALMYVQPIMCMALRMVLGGGILIALTAFFYPCQWHKVRVAWWHDRWLWLQAIVIYIYFVYISYFIGMRWLPSANIALYYNLTPFITAFLGYILIDQKMTPKKWLGLILGFTGVMPGIIYDTHTLFAFINMVEVLVLASVFAMAYGWFIVYQLMSLGYRSLLINSIGMTGAGVLAFLTSLLIEGMHQERYDAFKQLLTAHTSAGIPQLVVLLSALLIAIIATDLIYYNAIAFFMRIFSLVYISFVGMVTPILVALLNNLFLHEPLPRYFVVSFLMVMISFIIFYSEELSQADSARNG